MSERGRDRKRERPRERVRERGRDRKREAEIERGLTCLLLSFALLTRHRRRKKEKPLSVR